MKNRAANLAFFAFLAATWPATACDSLGGGKLAAAGGGLKSYGGFQGARGVGIAGSGWGGAGQTAARRQKLAAQAAARRQRRRPLRLARFAQLRAVKLAQRTARLEERIACRDAEQRRHQEFLAAARTWTDDSGQHQTEAVLVGVAGNGVDLQLQDGAVVHVPLGRLSPRDRLLALQLRRQAPVQLAKR